MTIRSYHPGAYATAEFFYEPMREMEFNAPLRGLPFSTKQAHIQLDTYYEHANNTGPHPNHQVNAAGLIIDLYFPPYKH